MWLSRKRIYQTEESSITCLVLKVLWAVTILLLLAYSIEGKYFRIKVIIIQGRM